MSERPPVRVGLVGIGGYGAAYVHSLGELEKEGLATLGAAVIRTRGKYPAQEKVIAEHDIPVVSTFEELLALGAKHFDIVAIPTGIAWHRDQMIQAVEAGFNVMLEKPTTAAIQDFDDMSAALARTNRWCQIGFQMQSDPTVRALKHAICEGRIGRIKEVIVRCFWTRDDHYYTRNSWAGRLTHKGRYTLDGCINNPQAHYLFNALYFASDQRGQAALPKTVRAELYHAHPIESEDTACLEVTCRNNVKVYFYGTLAATDNAPITIEVIGDNRRAIWIHQQGVKFYEGDQLVFELSPPAAGSDVEQWRNLIGYFRGHERELNCPLEMTRAHALVVNGAFLSMGKIRQIPTDALEVSEQSLPQPHIRTVIAGIEEIVGRGSADRKLYSDLGVPWAVKTRTVDVSNLKKFELPT